MEVIKDTVNSALETLGVNQQAPAKEPSEDEVKSLRAKYEKAGQDQVFVRLTLVVN